MPISNYVLGNQIFFGDAVLFNEDGREECVIDCFDDIHIGDVFKFETGEDTYVVTVVHDKSEKRGLYAQV